MNKKISDKDKKDWENFLSNKESLPDKDKIFKNKIQKLLKLDLHGFTLAEANKKISRGSIKSLIEFIDAKDYLNIKGWIRLLRNRYEERKTRHIVEYLLNVFIEVFLFLFLPFFAYKISFIYTPLIFLFNALFND